MKSSINLITVLMVVMIILSLNLLATLDSTQIDCLYLLSLLDKTMDLALRRDSNSLTYAEMMLRAHGIPLDLRDHHRETYRIVSEFIRLTTETPGSSDVIQRAYEIQSKIETIREYVARLEACSLNQEAARMLRINIGFKLNDIYADIGKIIALKSQDLMEMFQLREEYKPNEEIKLEIQRSLGVKAIEIYAWPSLIRISEYMHSEENETHIVFNIRVPTAIEIEVAGAKPVGRYDLMLALYTRFYNETYSLIGFTRVAYTRPSVWITSPSVIRRGTQLYVNVTSDGEYNVTVWLNRQSAMTTTITPGLNAIYIDYMNMNYTIGYNDVVICFEPGVNTLSTCIERQVIIEPNYPRVRITSSPAFISWLGTMQLVISNEDFTDTLVVIDSSWEERYINLPSGGTAYIEIFVGPFPVYLINNKITIQPTNETYDTMIQDLTILAINIPSIIIFMILSSLVIPTVSSRERGFIFLIATTWRGLEKPVEKTKADKQAMLLKPYEMGLGSNIALMLYGLIRKLKLRQPALHETLREHYVDASRYLSRKIRDAYWKMLLLAERDLYSSRKPKLSEAEELYYGVLSATTED